MNMKLLKYKYGIVAFFCLAATGAFSLFGMRYAASKQALQIKTLERELQKLRTLDRRMDLCLAHWQRQQRIFYAKHSTRRMLWINNDNRLPVKISLAYNR